jgi:hypothetical protein
MSAGSTVGKLIGNTAAYAVHGVAVSVNATGRFGSDIVASTGAQYNAKSSELAARRDSAVKTLPPQRKLKAAMV